MRRNYTQFQVPVFTRQLLVLRIPGRPLDTKKTAPNPPAPTGPFSPIVVTNRGGCSRLYAPANRITESLEEGVQCGQCGQLVRFTCSHLGVHVCTSDAKAESRVVRKAVLWGNAAVHYEMYLGTLLLAVLLCSAGPPSDQKFEVCR